MKKYKVRIEVSCTICELGEIKVLAHTKDDAKQLAILKYENNPSAIDLWQSNSINSTINNEFIDNWEIEELT